MTDDQYERARSIRNEIKSIEKVLDANTSQGFLEQAVGCQLLTDFQTHDLARQVREHLAAKLRSLRAEWHTL